MPRPARPGQLVVLTREHQQLGLGALTDERGVIARRLLQRTAEIELGVHDERRRGDLIRDGHRTLPSDVVIGDTHILVAEE